ncbi:hypothetical protein ACLOJK_003882 [Asimina triloba]
MPMSSKETELENIPVVRKFFPEKLLGLSLTREIDVGSVSNSILRAPYLIALVKIQEVTLRHMISGEGVSDPKMIKAVSSKRCQCSDRHSESEVKCDNRNFDHSTEDIVKTTKDLRIEVVTSREMARLGVASAVFVGRSDQGGLEA